MIKYRDTSREAWESFDEVSGQLDRDILTTIKNHPGGIICEHIEVTLSRKHQAVSGNLRHLVERGFVMASGDYGHTRSGRRAIKWIIAPVELITEVTW